MPARSEDASLINCREIEGWCKECHQHRPPVMSAVTFFIGSFGLFVGLVSGLASTNRPGWHAIFLAGTLLSALALVASAIAVGITWKKPNPGRMQALADRMQRAKDHNRVPAEEEIPTTGSSE